MKVARSVAEILSQHTTLALECIDRLYLTRKIRGGCDFRYRHKSLRVVQV